MNILSLFDGISCGQEALRRMGIKVDNYFASEIDKYAIQVTQKNFPNTIQLGDVRNIKGSDLPKIDLVIGGSPCFTEGNLVLTKDGYKDIKDIVVGDFVLTHKGRYKKVLRVGGDYKKTLKIKAQGSTPIVTTENHPFYSIRKNRCWNNKIRTYDVSYSNPKWKNIGEFDENDKALSIIIKKEVDIPELSDIDLYILGRFVADGYCHKYKRKGRKNSYQYRFCITCGKHEIEDFKNKVDDRFNYVEERTAIKAFIYQQKWLELGEKFGKGAKNKFIPNFILNLPIERLKIFLNGYFDGDGHMDGEYQYATTISEKLTLTLSLAVQKCYHGVSIEKTIRPKKYIIEGRVVNQNNTYRVNFKREKTPYSKFIVTDNYVGYKVKKREETNLLERVYNIEVEDDNSYIVNNLIVHNCQGFSFSGKMLNFEDPRSKLFFEFNRLLRETNPKYFLLENVKMKQSFKDVITEYLGVEPILINSNLVSAQNRPRLYWTNIPNVTQPEDKEIYLNDIIERGVDTSYEMGIQDKNILKVMLKEEGPVAFTERRTEEAKRIRREYREKYGRDFSPRRGKEMVPRKDNKMNCLTASFSNKEHTLVDERSLYRKITPLEAERLQTLPDGYTEGLTDTQRYKACGNGWTVDVITHIFSGLEK